MAKTRSPAGCYTAPELKFLNNCYRIPELLSIPKHYTETTRQPRLTRDGNPMNTAVQPESEASLIEDLKRGDSTAYRRAVREYSPGMLAVARFYLDHSSAEEIVQDCWVTVIDAVQKFEGRSGLKTWLHRIVANRCKNRLRTAKREVATDFSETLEPELANRFNSTGRWDLPPKLQFHDSADTLMENGALSDCLDKHLSALPETSVLPDALRSSPA